MASSNSTMEGPFMIHTCTVAYKVHNSGFFFMHYAVEFKYIMLLSRETMRLVS